MRSLLPAAAIALLDLLVIAVATTACEVLCCLDGSDVPLAPLVVGDLRPLFASESFRTAFPSSQPPAELLAFGPGACIAVLAALLVAAARRWPRAPAVVFAALALLGGAIPFAVGVAALHGNTVSEHAGSWLRWQLAGPALAALVSLAFLAWGARPERAGTALAARPATTSAVAG